MHMINSFITVNFLCVINFLKPNFTTCKFNAVSPTKYSLDVYMTFCVTNHVHDLYLDI